MRIYNNDESDACYDRILKIDPNNDKAKKNKLIVAKAKRNK